MHSDSNNFNPESLKVLSKAALINLLCRQPRTFDAFDLHQIFRNCSNRIAKYHREVLEGKNLMEASDFTRWLQMSGIPKLFESNPQVGNLEVNANILRRAMQDLIFECGEKFKGGKIEVKYQESDIAAINGKLDLLAAHIARLTPAPVETTAETPALHVLQAPASA